MLLFCMTNRLRESRRNDIAELRVNGNIRAREVRVVAPDGSQVGVKTTQEAMWLADQLGLDLVEVAPGAKPPVCKIMDYGTYKYENSVRDREARKKQTRTVIKEVRMKPRIGVHDYEILLRRTMQFLSEGDKVKVTVRFRGRENERPELGYNLVRRLVDDVGEYAQRRAVVSTREDEELDIWGKPKSKKKKSSPSSSKPPKRTAAR